MIKILFVDDNPDHLSLARLFLEKGGIIKVDTVLSGQDALTKLKEASYDAVISDFHMPEMDGIALLKAIRQDYQRLPFIILTARDESDIAIAALNFGATFFLKKEGSPRQMFAELDTLLIESVEKARKLKEVIETQNLVGDIIRSSPVGIAVFDEQFRCILVNPAWTRLFGITGDKHTGKPVGELIPRVPEQWKVIHTRLMKNGPPLISLEETLNTAAGINRVHSVYISRVAGESAERQMIQYLIPLM